MPLGSIYSQAGSIISEVAIVVRLPKILKSLNTISIGDVGFITVEYTTVRVIKPFIRLAFYNLVFLTANIVYISDTIYAPY